MALEKLKKWLGTQAMTAFFDQLNDNVDATNAAIDLVETNTNLIDFSSSLTLISGVSALRAYKVGHIHFLAFTYKPTQIGFTTAITGIPSAYLPGIYFAGSVATVSTHADAGRAINAAIGSNGNVTVGAATLPNYSMQFTFTWIA